MSAPFLSTAGFTEFERAFASSASKGTPRPPALALRALQQLLSRPRLDLDRPLGALAHPVVAFRCTRDETARLVGGR